MANEIEVYVANLGKYTEGNLQGGWIELPKPEEEIKKFLSETVGLNERYEEYAIHDYNKPPIAVDISEYSNLYELNMIATLANDLNAHQTEAVNAYLSSAGNLGYDEVMNLLVQSEDIPYYEYFFEGIENCSNMSSQELYGYTKAEQSGVTEQLEKMGIESYFDYESYGRDDELSGYVDLFEHGYINTQSGLDLHKYSEQDIKDIVGQTKEESIKNQEKNILADIKRSGFQPNRQLVENIKNCGGVSLAKISEMHKSNSVPDDMKESVGKIVAECRRQELALSR